MAAALDLLPRATMTALPALIGVCEHCGQSLYEHAPLAAGPALSHIACAVYALRHPV